MGLSACRCTEVPVGRNSYIFQGFKVPLASHAFRWAADHDDLDLANHPQRTMALS